MHISEMKESKFLKKEDCGTGILVTIKAVVQENMAKEGEQDDLKWCLEFDDPNIKPMTLNSTNNQLIAMVTGQEDTDNWPGHKIVLYSDPSVMYKGKVTGGIRVRAPRGRAAATAKPSAPAPAPSPQQRSSLPPSQQPQPEELAGDDSDDVPF